MLRRALCFSLLSLLGCSGLVSPDDSRLDPANARVDAGGGGGRDSGRDTGGGGPDGGGEGDCTVDGDCDDGVECTRDRCIDSFCSFAPDDTSCEASGDPCVATSFCDAREGCQNVPVECSDGVDCTRDRCESARGCVFESVCEDGESCSPTLGCTGGGCTADADCRDEDLCTAEVCAGGVCQRPPRVCPPSGNPCQTSGCDPATGECVARNVADGTMCPDDGNRCTTDETCEGGVCTARSVNACPPGDNPCVTPSCDPGSGDCRDLPVPPGAACDDGDPCTSATVCDGAGGCGGGLRCPDDGNPCTAEHCTATGCISEEAPPGMTCPIGSAGGVGLCCAGSCVDPSIDSTNCGDCGNDCGGTLCIDGFCAECNNSADCPDAPADCIRVNCRSGFCEYDLAAGSCYISGTCVAAGTHNPSNPCLVCNPDRDPEGWALDEGASCDDGRFCTVEDLCQATPTGSAVCLGRPRSCPGDDNRCTAEFCNEDANACQFRNRINAECYVGGVRGACCVTAGAAAAMCVPGISTCPSVGP